MQYQLYRFLRSEISGLFHCQINVLRNKLNRAILYLIWVILYGVYTMETSKYIVAETQSKSSWTVEFRIVNLDKSVLQPCANACSQFTVQNMTTRHTLYLLDTKCDTRIFNQGPLGSLKSYGPYGHWINRWSTPETLTLDNGRSPVAELNELTNALAKWTISERNDDGMIKGYLLTSF